MSQKHSEFLAGVRAEVPLLVGVAPFGMIYGLLALKAGVSAGAAQAMSAILFAGSSQFLTAQLMRVSAPGVVIILTIAIVNLRHMLYSASLAPHLKHLSTSWKLLLSYLLTDEAYAVTITHYEKEDPKATTHFYFLGAGLALWMTWQTSTALGIFLGATLPSAWPLDFALPLTFIAIVVPAIRTRPALGAALCAGIAALLAAGLPYQLGLMVAALSGVAAALLLEPRR